MQLRFNALRARGLGPSCTANAVVQMGRLIAQRRLYRQSIETGAKQGLPEIALEAIFEQVGGAVCARGNRLLAEHDGNELAPVTRLSPNSPQPQGRVGVSFDGAHRVKKPLVALQIERRA